MLCPLRLPFFPYPLYTDHREFSYESSLYALDAFADISIMVSAYDIIYHSFDLLINNHVPAQCYLKTILRLDSAPPNYSPMHQIGAVYTA